MRIPRYISGLELIKLLEPFGYSVSRQAGSHIRLTTQHNGPHHITVPNYDPLKNRSIHCCAHLNKTMEEMLQLLFE